MSPKPIERPVILVETESRCTYHCVFMLDGRLARYRYCVSKCKKGATENSELPKL